MRWCSARHITAAITTCAALDLDKKWPLAFSIARSSRPCLRAYGRRFELGFECAHIDGSKHAGVRSRAQDQRRPLEDAGKKMRRTSLLRLHVLTM
ncbi:hypothetical protein B0H21DRAFT_754920 [Amylocystis lapponica]|nr:hypothetical protein B0H21DRAFT_754920 [Amylocystis lapponica]